MPGLDGLGVIRAISAGCLRRLRDCVFGFLNTPPSRLLAWLPDYIVKPYTWNG
jgi:hypothetical protein